MRTLDRLITALVRANALPSTFVITVPKVTVVEQVDYVVVALSALERSLELPRGTLRFEIMVEVPQAIIDAGGKSLLPRLLDASDGRLTAIDFGTYDYTAALGITAAYQRLRHPACDFAKHMIQAAFAGTGVRIADGSTALLPIPIHDAAALSDAQRAENVGRRARGMDGPLRRRASFARRRILSGLGSARRATRVALRGGVELLPRGRGPRGRAPHGIPQSRRERDARRRNAR